MDALNGYIVYVGSIKYEVYAATTFEAQTKALELAHSRKKYPVVSVHLVEAHGEQVTSVITN